ncbi:hypothetical protein ABZV93_27995 [Actinopolymorpha sp. NPDC004070]|uniref:hypothetical protein n=1 Tax=Actinopolymorpha sp. NPDC004070 TaxID=3154548 RepID=UPI0033B223C4
MTTTGHHRYSPVESAHELPFRGGTKQAASSVTADRRGVVAIGILRHPSTG